MMAYLYAYLAMGSVVCVAVLVSHLRADSTRLYKRSAFLDALHPERKTRRYRILTEKVVPVLSGIALVLVWPIGVFMKVKDLAERRAQGACRVCIRHKPVLEAVHTNLGTCVPSIR